jgi:hypothetical protein
VTRAASVGGLYPSLATAFLTTWRIEFAAGLHGLHYYGKSGAVTCGAFSFGRIRGRSFHCVPSFRAEGWVVRAALRPLPG